MSSRRGYWGSRDKKMIGYMVGYYNTCVKGGHHSNSSVVC